jgi:uncharacterized protein (DUF608 family)
MKKAKPYASKNLRGKQQRVFSGESLLQVAMPLGGIGAGCICLNGIGGLQDFSIRHQPAVTATADAHGSNDAAFALLHIKSKQDKAAVTRLVEGPMPTRKIYNQGLKGQGYRGGGHEGLPRFRQCDFRGEYPFGYVTLTDSQIPLQVQITGFNPFIPLDDKNSGIPCAILEYTLKNTSKEAVDYEFSYHLSHLASGPNAREQTGTRNEIIANAGIFFGNSEPANAPTKGSASLTVVGHSPTIKGMWFRGGWFDAISALWREVSTGHFQSNDGSNGSDSSGRNGGSIKVLAHPSMEALKSNVSDFQRLR